MISRPVFAESLPFVNRDDECLAALTILKSQYQYYLACLKSEQGINQDTYMKQFRLISCPGAPGTGKTTWARHLLSRVNDPQPLKPSESYHKKFDASVTTDKPFDVNVDTEFAEAVRWCITHDMRLRLSFASPWQDTEKQCPDLAIAVRILWESLKTRGEFATIKSSAQLWNAIYHSFVSFSIRDVLQYWLGEADDGLTKMVYINLDEVNALVPRDLDIIIMQIMDVHMTSGVFVCPILTSTIASSVTEAVKIFGCGSIKIALPLLETAHVQLIVEKLYSQNGEPSPTEMNEMQ